MGDIDQDLIYIIYAFAILTTVSGLVYFGWVVVLGRRDRLFPIPRERRGSWQGREVLLSLLLFMLVPALVQDLLSSIGFFQSLYGEVPVEKKEGKRGAVPKEETEKKAARVIRQTLWSTLLALPLTVAILFLALFLASGTRPAHLGLTTARIPHNVVIGCLIGAPLTFLTLAVFFLVTFLMPPEQHPLERLAKSELTPVEWVLVVFQAVVAAPVLEELVFRGVLLGWLRRCSALGHYGVALGAVLAACLPILAFFQTEDQTRELNVGPLIFVLVLVPLYLELMETIRQRTPPKPHSEIMAEGMVSTHAPLSGPQPPFPDLVQTRRRANALIAILGSSLLFSAFHSLVWPTPIPLLFLGLGLGWLAYRTQSLVSAMTVHAFFNAVACLALGMSIWF